jgi:hypothetical protein
VNLDQSVKLQDQFLVVMVAGLVLRIVQLRESDIPHLAAVKHLYQRSLNSVRRADPDREHVVLGKTALTQVRTLSACYIRVSNLLYIRHYCLQVAKISVSTLQPRHEQGGSLGLV